MLFWMTILCVIHTHIVVVKTITITPNGNSPEAKMTGAMPMYISDHLDSIASESIQENKKYTNETDGFKKYHTKIALNERYRRLIPYMTFYYANDLITPANYEAKNIEVEKAEIIQTAPVTPERVPKVVYLSQRHKNIPRYFGNRLTQYNIASSNPSKLYYKVPTPPTFQQSPKITHYNPVYQEPNTFEYSDRTYERLIPKYNKPHNEHYQSTRKPHIFPNEDTDNVQYYSAEKEDTPLYKLVPYEQTPPVIVSLPNKQTPIPQSDYDVTNAVVNDHVFIKPRPKKPQQIQYNSQVNQELKIKKPATVSESYYEQRPKSIIVEDGFNPIIDPSATDAPNYAVHNGIRYLDLNNNKQENEANPEDATYRPTYVEKNLHKIQPESSPVTISNLIQSLHLNKPIPKSNTRNNVGASINTLLRVLNTLKVMSQSTNAEPSGANTESTNKPYVASKIYETTSNPVLSISDPQIEFQEEPYLAPVNTPSQHLDDTPNPGGTSQRFPLPIHSDDEGGTPGKPGIDYPILTVIPETSFNCKTQRYKGFFADTETRCQVWHYCDLNGGQASFLCPNGTIFSQAGLTCDWWFNVRCASTTQLYVLNESLYKFILPHSPKFPEDYSGPLVDKYLSLKFKEMEEQFKKNKKGTADDKTDSSDESTEKEVENSTENNVESAVAQGHVSVQSAGHSGNVERLRD